MIDRFKAENTPRQIAEAHGATIQGSSDTTWAGSCPICDDGQDRFHSLDQGEAWRCRVCHEKPGDALELATILGRHARPSDCLRARGYLSDRPRTQAEVERDRAEANKATSKRARDKARRDHEKAERLRGVASQSASLWLALPPITDETPGAAAWVRSRDLDPGSGVPADLARAVPPGRYLPRAFGGWRKKDEPPATVAIPEYDEHANLVTLQGRGVGMKGRAASGGRRGLYLNGPARALLGGQLEVGAPDAVLVVEGEGDWLLWSLLRPDLPVIGIVNGQVEDLARRLVELGVSLVWLRTDTDDSPEQRAKEAKRKADRNARWRRPGDHYAIEFREAAAGRIRLLRPARDGYDDDGDRWKAGELDLDPAAGCDLYAEPAELVEGDQLCDWILEGLTGDHTRPGLAKNPTGTGKTHQAIEAVSRFPGRLVIASAQGHDHAQNEWLDKLRAHEGLDWDEVGYLGPFACPLESQEERANEDYKNAVGNGWSGTKAACGPCERRDGCAYYRGRQDALKARILVGVLELRVARAPRLL
ncbi:MAG: hypothetical protein JKY65_15485, partial [Planctomycetes bacterium]|nr:hypothetical protein [Planctomycetota bacterium]